MANEQEIQQITDILNWTGQENETALSPMEKDELKKRIQDAIKHIQNGNT